MEGVHFQSRRIGLDGSHSSPPGDVQRERQEPILADQVALAGVYSLRGIPPQSGGGGIFAEFVGVPAILRSLRMTRQHAKDKR